MDGDTFDESDKPALHPLTDWHIVVAPPLVIENTLPIAGHYIVWEQPQVPDLHQGGSGRGRAVTSRVLARIERAPRKRQHPAL